MGHTSILKGHQSTLVRIGLLELRITPVSAFENTIEPDRRTVTDV